MNTVIIALVLGVIFLGGGAVLIYKYRQKPTAKELPGKDSKAQLEAEALVDAEVIEDIPPLAATSAAPAEEIQSAPESLPSRMQRVRARLAKSNGLGKALLSVLSRADLQRSDWEEIEETLLLADVGLDATTELLDILQREVKVRGNSDSAVVREILRTELLKLVEAPAPRELQIAPTRGESGESLPAAILMVGVNGTGKTTTTGKLARLLVAENKKVVLGAADTFRAAAADQLQTWGERVGVPVVRAAKEGADPAAVAFDAVEKACQDQADVVIVDTAGRLQNKAGLMDELSKIKRVMEKKVPVKEVLLVLDATTGQNGLRQAEVFTQAAGVSGIVLAKLDGTAKGGIVISVQRELGVPVKFIGLGEGADDFAPFAAEAFVDSLLG